MTDITHGKLRKGLKKFSIKIQANWAISDLFIYLFLNPFDIIFNGAFIIFKEVFIGF